MLALFLKWDNNYSERMEAVDTEKALVREKLQAKPE